MDSPCCDAASYTGVSHAAAPPEDLDPQVAMQQAEVLGEFEKMEERLRTPPAS